LLSSTSYRSYMNSSCHSKIRVCDIIIVHLL
jgi:hypothetical protein